jgi:hypothetical protein
MDKKFSVPIDVFHTDVEVFITDDIHATCEKLDIDNNDKRNKIAETITGFEDALSIYVNKFKGGMVYKRFIVLLSPDATDVEVVHECLHTAWHILNHKGIYVEVDNHEALSYLQGYLFGKIQTKLLSYQSKD